MLNSPSFSNTSILKNFPQLKTQTPTNAEAIPEQPAKTQPAQVQAQAQTQPTQKITTQNVTTPQPAQTTDTFTREAELKKAYQKILKQQESLYKEKLNKIEEDRKKERTRNTLISGGILLSYVVFMIAALRGQGPKNLPPRMPSPDFPTPQIPTPELPKMQDLWEDISKALRISDMSLPKTLKTLLEKVVKNITNPEAIRQRGGKGIKTILLYGPPGTGKTTFAKAIAKEFEGAEFASLDVTQLSSKYVGETEKNIQESVNEICRRARQNPHKKFFVFIDEIDSIMMVNDGNGKKYSNDVLNEFKRCFSEKLGKEDNIITIGATNIHIDPDVGRTFDGKMLDRPMLDRFQEKILVDRPTAGQLRDAIVHHYRNAAQVSEEIKSADSEKLRYLCEFLAKRERETSFRTLQSLFNAAASEGDIATTLTMKDLYHVIKSKKVELHISDDELAQLKKVLIG